MAAGTLTWIPWKSCCRSSQLRRQSPSGSGGGDCIVVHATGRGKPRVERTELQPRPAGGASATAPVRFRARAAEAANGKRLSVIRARAPPLGAANRSQRGDWAGPRARRASPSGSVTRPPRSTCRVRFLKTTHKARRHVLPTLQSFFQDSVSLCSPGWSGTKKSPCFCLPACGD